MSASTFTALDKLKAAEREIGQRKRVYPRLIEGGRMSQKAADHQIAVMEAIADDYREAVKKEGLL